VRHTRRLVDEDSKHARLTAAAQFNFYNLQPAGDSHSLRNLANLVNIKCHENNSLRPICDFQNGPKLKSGLSPTGVSRQMPVLHNSSSYQYTPRCAKKQTARGGETVANCGILSARSKASKAEKIRENFASQALGEEFALQNSRLRKRLSFVVRHPQQRTTEDTEGTEEH
jgi:hypothetical protein